MKGVLPMEKISLYDLLKFYARRYLTLIATALAGAIIGVVYTFFIQQPMYKSTATLLAVGTGQQLCGDQGSVAINNYVELFKSRRVLDLVIDDQKYEEDYEALAKSIEAINVKNTDVISVSVLTLDAKKSQALLESIIKSFNQEAIKLYDSTDLRTKVVDPPNAPDEPDNIKPVMQISLASVTSLALGALSLFFVYDYRMSEEASKKTKKAKEKDQNKKTPKSKSKTMARVKRIRKKTEVKVKKK